MTIRDSRDMEFFNPLPQGVIRLTPEHQITYWNRAARQILLGGDSSFTLREPQSSYSLHPEPPPSQESDELAPLLAALMPELATFQASAAPEAAYLKSFLVQGQNRHLEMICRRLPGTPGAPGDTIIFLDDRTALRQVEEALHTLEEKCRACMANPSEGVIITDVFGHIIEGNPKIADLLGCPPEDLTHLSLPQLHPAEELSTTMASLQDLVQAGGGTLPNQWLQCQDGTLIPVDINICVLHFANRTLVRYAYRDISDRQRREADALRLSKLTSLSRLAGGLAHDFNNILTAILGNITLALLDPEMNPFCQERLQEAEKACFRAQDLSHQLLTFSKGGQPLKKTLSLVNLLSDKAANLRRSEKSTLQLDIAPDLWPVEADPTQIQHVIANLLINADQAMPNGGTIRLDAVNVTLSQDENSFVPPGRYVKISVADQGAGIPKEHLHEIFDPYFSTSDHRHGLGLALVHTIVSHHQGFITVDTQPGVGSFFHIFLPSRDPASLPVDNIVALPASGQGRILLLDDEAVIRDIVSRMLAKLGYETDTAAHGAEAISLYQQSLEMERPYDAVIFDLTIIGGMGGKEALEHLRQIDPYIKAIVSSGYSDDPVMAHYHVYGFAGVLAKPYKLTELARVVGQVMTLSKPGAMP